MDPKLKARICQALVQMAEEFGFSRITMDAAQLPSMAMTMTVTSSEGVTFKLAISDEELRNNNEEEIFERLIPQKGIKLLKEVKAAKSNG